MSVQYVAEVYVDLGEKIHVRSTVKPKCDADLPFEILSAQWELVTMGGVTESSGDCTIEDHVIDAFISPQNIGTYKLRYIYHIADEIWVDVVKVKVS